MKTTNTHQYAVFARTRGQLYHLAVNIKKMLHDLPQWRFPSKVTFAMQSTAFLSSESLEKVVMTKSENVLRNWSP